MLRPSEAPHANLLPCYAHPGCVHDLRKMFAQAAFRALLPDYATAMLRCDSARTKRAVYDTEMPPHDWAEMVAADQVQ